MRGAALLLALLALVAAACAGGHYGHHHHHGHGGYYGHCHGRYGCKHPSPAPSHSTEPSHPPSHTGTRCGAETAALELAYEEFDLDAFEAGVGRFSHGLSDIADVRLRCIVLERNPARRRSLLADAPVLVTFELKSSDATAVARALTDAARDGTLDELLALLGGQLSGYTIMDGQGNTMYSKVSSVNTRSIESPAPAPTVESPAAAEQLEAIPATLNSMPWAAAEAPSQAPADSATAAIAAAGGAIGGGVGGLLVLAATAYLLMRKKASAGSSFAVGNPIFTPQSGNAGVTATLAAGAPAKAGLELEEVIQQTGTPRSARRRNATPFHDGEGSS